MATLVEIQRAADQLSDEERVGLAAHLLASISTMPLGPDDEEADRRDLEMDLGLVQPISHDEFVRQVGRA